MIAGAALMFLFGWFLMKRLDRFLDENQKRIEEAPEQQQPEQCVHLAGNISPDELEKTLSRFRSSHFSNLFVKKVVQDLTSGGLLGVWGKWVKHAKYIQV